MESSISSHTPQQQQKTTNKTEQTKAKFSWFFLFIIYHQCNIFYLIITFTNDCYQY